MDGGYKLKLCSKKLRSGRCQIKFYVTPPGATSDHSFYGYMLAESGSTLREVVGRIEEQMRRFGQEEYGYQDQLFNLGRRREQPSPIYFFRES